MEIEMDSENESQPKRIGKPPLLLSQEELLAEKVKKYPFACLTKVKTRTKNEKLFKKFSLSKTFFFEVLNMQTQKGSVSWVTVRAFSAQSPV